MTDPDTGPSKVIGASIEYVESEIVDGFGRLVPTYRHYDVTLTVRSPGFRPLDQDYFVASVSTFEDALGMLNLAARDPDNV